MRKTHHKETLLEIFHKEDGTTIKTQVPIRTEAETRRLEALVKTLSR